MSSVSPQRPRASVYIDGFNLYHGCFDDHRLRADWRQYRWLDLGTFCAKAFPSYDIRRIRYFTALVNPSPANPDCRQRQLAYIRALETIPHLSVYLGRFATNAKNRPLADPNSRKPKPSAPVQIVRIIEEEEKGSDVNLASYLLLDGFRQDYDVAVVISNDSDLAEPITMVSRDLGLKVLLVNPRTKVATDLLNIADGYRSIRLGTLRDSQFPETFTDANGVITKPASWRSPAVVATLDVPT